MKKFHILLIITALATGLTGCANEEKAAMQLVERVTGRGPETFRVKISKSDSPDYFSLYSAKGKIVLEGNDGVSAASALKYYLENHCHVQADWSSEFPLDLPEVLPLPDDSVTKYSPYKYRYCLNYCTFNYSMSWWDEQRWQKEIDLMAMNGINTPLALTGQNSVWKKVYNRLGFSDGQLEDFFSGPTHFSWFWMGNLDGWGGPLRQSFMDRHEQLQKFILRRERSLGMKPVLPAFTGHVPPAFKEKFPDSEVNQTDWEGFAPVNILAPQDSMFNVIGRMFMEEQTKMYGTDHLYSADTFNENLPPTNDSLYLDAMSKKVYDSMAEYDPEAVWIMQGWLFHYMGNFWKEKEIQALVNAVPDEKMIILDLWSERFPVFSRTDSYYGKQWIWCMLHNFGQNHKWEGHWTNVATKPAMTKKSGAGRNMQGIGFTMEGIEQTPVLYALMAENVWRDEPVDVHAFLEGYLRNRYGEGFGPCAEAWEILSRTVFEHDFSGGGFPSAITERPSLTERSYKVSERHVEKYMKPLLSALEIMIESAEADSTLMEHEGFRYDIVDMCRQALSDYSNVLHTRMARAYKAKDAVQFEACREEFLGLIADMDRLLSYREEFRLENWIESARAMGTTEEEKDGYEFNARNLVTLWGGRDCKIHDYSWRQWSGLMNGFYAPRWELFFGLTEGGMAPEEVSERLKDWEWEWCNSVGGYDSARGCATITLLEFVTSLHEKYLADIEF